MAVTITFGAINVNSLNRNASVAVGENVQSSWDSHAKNNFGFGLNIGLSVVPNNLNIIVDNDIIDVPISDPDIVPTVQNQSL